MIKHPPRVASPSPCFRLPVVAGTSYSKKVDLSSDDMSLISCDHSTCFGCLLLLINLSGPFFVPLLPQYRFFGLSVFPVSLQLLPLLLCLATLLDVTLLLFFLKITAAVGKVGLWLVIVENFHVINLWWFTTRKSTTISPTFLLWVYLWQPYLCKVLPFNSQPTVLYFVKKNPTVWICFSACSGLYLRLSPEFIFVGLPNFRHGIGLLVHRALGEDYSIHDTENKNISVV